MMDREEAKSEIEKSVFTAYELQFEQYANDSCEQFSKLLDMVYDSIGSCGECKWFGECATFNEMQKNSDKPDIELFCADFKRKD